MKSYTAGKAASQLSKSTRLSVMRKVPSCIGQLAQVTVTKQPTVTRLLDRMELRGQVERLPHESDRRITLVRITKTGPKAVENLMELARDHERRVLEAFGLRRADELKHTLRQMIDQHVHGDAQAEAPAED